MYYYCYRSGFILFYYAALNSGRFFASFFFCDLSHPAMSKAKSSLTEKNRGTNSKRGVQSF